MKDRYTGLIAAVFTPMHEDGSVNLARVPAVVDHMIRTGVNGLYVCGSTGEGPSLSSDERRATAAAYVEASAGRLPVIVQVGHNSLAEARALASHAAQVGADAISAMPPSYYGIASAGALIDCLREIVSGAPDLPLFYYHIPALTRVELDMVEFLAEARGRLPHLVGLKYTHSTIDEYQACLEFGDRRYLVLFGRDEMLLSALSVGASGAVGSTYNFAGPLYRRLIDAFQRGDLGEARRCQYLADGMIRILCRHGGQPAFKAAMKLVGVDCGPNRLPLVTRTSEQVQRLKRELQELGFFDWALPED